MHGQCILVRTLGEMADLKFMCRFTKRNVCRCILCTRCTVESFKTYIFRDHGIPILDGHEVTSALANQALDFAVSLVKRRSGFHVQTLQELSGLNILSTLEEAHSISQLTIAVLPIPRRLKQILYFLEQNFFYTGEILTVPTLLVHHIGAKIYIKDFSEEDYAKYREQMDEKFLYTLSEYLAFLRD